LGSKKKRKIGIRNGRKLGSKKEKFGKKKEEHWNVKRQKIGN
jgi:hypothetical protein